MLCVGQVLIHLQPIDCPLNTNRFSPSENEPLAAAISQSAGPSAFVPNLDAAPFVHDGSSPFSPETNFSTANDFANSFPQFPQVPVNQSALPIISPNPLMGSTVENAINHSTFSSMANTNYVSTSLPISSPFPFSGASSASPSIPPSSSPIGSIAQSQTSEPLVGGNNTDVTIISPSALGHSAISAASFLYNISSPYNSSSSCPLLQTNSALSVGPIELHGHRSYDPIFHVNGQIVAFPPQSLQAGHPPFLQPYTPIYLQMATSPSSVNQPQQPYLQMPRQCIPIHQKLPYHSKVYYEEMEIIHKYLDIQQHRMTATHQELEHVHHMLQFWETTTHRSSSSPSFAAEPSYYDIPQNRQHASNTVINNAGLMTRVIPHWPHLFLNPPLRCFLLQCPLYKLLQCSSLQPQGVLIVSRSLESTLLLTLPVTVIMVDRLLILVLAFCHLRALSRLPLLGPKYYACYAPSMSLLM